MELSGMSPVYANTELAYSRSILTTLSFVVPRVIPARGFFICGSCQESEKGNGTAAVLCSRRSFF